MKCKQFRELIINSLGSGQSNLQDTQIQEHANNCTRCRAILEENKSLANIASVTPAWQPEEVYWNSLLTRIHLRIEKKNEPEVPSWIYRGLAPAAAALLLVALSLSLFIFNGENDDLFVNGISENDIASYIEQESIIGSYMANNAGRADTIGHDDATVLYNLLKSESNVASYYEDKAGSILETVNEDEAEKLFAMLSDDIKK